VTQPEHPLLIYPGGKWKLAEQIVNLMPPHDVYVEPFAGAASVLIHKPRSLREIVNDLDGEIVALFKVLRDPELSRQLIDLVTLTPFSRQEMQEAYDQVDCDLERARRIVVKNNMGRGKAYHRTGLRTTRDPYTACEKTWARFPAALTDIARRFKGVVIENLDALEIVKRYDGPTTLFYVDPPYPTESRRCPRLYNHEMTDAQHVELIQQLESCVGMVLLSGYDTPIYNALSWKAYRFKTKTNANTDATEVVWVNEAVRKQNRQMEMEI
jgi:DNA adenine methylase